MIKALGSNLYIIDGTKIIDAACVYSIGGIGEKITQFGQPLLDDIRQVKRDIIERQEIELALEWRNTSADYLQQLRDRKKLKFMLRIGAGNAPFIDSGIPTYSQDHEWLVFDGNLQAWQLDDLTAEGYLKLSLTVKAESDIINTKIVKVPFVDNVTFTGGIYWR